MYGERAVSLFDSLTIKDEKNGLYADIVFNPDRKSGLKALFSSKNTSEKHRFDEIEGVISKNA